MKILFSALLEALLILGLMLFLLAIVYGVALAYALIRGSVIYSF
jgi:hypothetical protein